LTLLDGSCEAVPMKTVLTFVVVLAAACGGKQTPAATTGTGAGTGTGTGAHHAGGEHPDMDPQMTKFHDVLAPRWHAAKGPARMTDTCAAIPQFKTNAAAIANSAAPPSAEAASWSTATKELTVSVAALEGACTANETEFETAFERVHTVFHAVMELGEVKGDHGEHAGHAE